jgi:hypothetical protein
MRVRVKCLLLFLLLAAGCLGYRVSTRDLVIAVGEEVPVVVESIDYFGGQVLYHPVAIHSTDESIARVTAGPSPTLVRGLHPGTAYLEGNGNVGRFATVTVFECPPVSMSQSPAVVAIAPGKRIDLTVSPKGYQWISLQWFEERNATWQTIAFATVTGYAFTPTRTGSYRFQARYHDRCGDATATFLVNVTDRVRAVR